MHIPPVSEAIEKNTYYEPKDPSEIDLIPLEIAVAIFSLLSELDFCAFSCVSRKWGDWTKNHCLRFVKERNPFLYHCKEMSEIDPNWQAMVARLGLIDRNLSIGRFVHTILDPPTPIWEGYYAFSTMEGGMIVEQGIGLKRRLSIVHLGDQKLTHAFDSDYYEIICRNLIWIGKENVLFAWDIMTGKLIYQLDEFQGNVTYIKEFQNKTITVCTKTKEGQYLLYLLDPKKKKLVFLSPPEKAPIYKWPFYDTYLPQLSRKKISVLWSNSDATFPSLLVMATYSTESPERQIQPDAQMDLPKLKPREFIDSYYEFEGLYLAHIKDLDDSCQKYYWRIFKKPVEQDILIEILFDKRIQAFVCFSEKIVLLYKENQEYTLQEFSTETHLLGKELLFGRMSQSPFMRQVYDDKIILLALDKDSEKGNLIVVNAKILKIDKNTPFPLNVQGDFCFIIFDEEKIIFKWGYAFHVLDFANHEKRETESFTISNDNNFKMGKIKAEGKDIVLDEGDWQNGPFLSKTVILVSIVAVAAFALYFGNRL